MTEPRNDAHHRTGVDRPRDYRDPTDPEVFGTSGGIPVTDELIETLAAEAEAGYDTDRLKMAAETEARYSSMNDDPR